jgi:hypothetical protein
MRQAQQYRSIHLQGYDYTQAGAYKRPPHTNAIITNTSSEMRTT